MKRASILLSLWALTACEQSEAIDAGIDAPAMRDTPPFDAWVPPISRDPIEAGNALSEGDALYEGQQRFLYDTFGTEVLDGWPPADFMIDLMTAEPDVFGDQFASFGFIADPDRDLPYGFVRGADDPSRVHESCALCHIGRLPDGSLWIGMPNAELDVARFRYEVSQRWVAAGHAPLISATEASKALAYGPGRTGAESGDYPDPVPADFPPYLNLGDRTALNYLGTGRDLRSEVFLSVFSAGAGAPNARNAIVPFPSDARIGPFIAFMGSLTPPPAPAGDAASIAMGASLFVREGCDGCHHVEDVSLNGITTYDRELDGLERAPGEDPDYPRGSIRTSYPHRILVDGVPETDAGTDVDAGAGMDDVRADLIRFIASNGLRVANSDGYRVDDLHALWVTAPYLHNGSVPTLEDLLRPPSERPVTFERGTFTVDTTAPGNSNEGHAFGTTISEDERTALAAYLRSL
jgi:mono/diheme cytochrome c family protein